jgi:hypothetical protein
MCGGKREEGVEKREGERRGRERMRETPRMRYTLPRHIPNDLLPPTGPFFLIFITFQ